MTITKSITIDGGPGIAGVLVSGTNGIVVAVGSSDRVVLRNLQIDGLTTGLSGVLFNSSGQLVLEHDNIWGFTGIQESPGNPGSACVKFVPTGLSRLFIDDVHCQFNINGIDIAPTGGGGAGVEISKSYFQMNSNDGLRANATNGTVNVVVNDDVFTGNTNYGVEAFNGGLVAVTGSVITNSSTSGLNADSGGTVIAGGNTISRNNVGISASPGGSMQTFGDNYFVANVTNTAGTISSAGSKQ